MCQADFDPPKFLLERWRKARKPWRCDDCWYQGPPGTRYLQVTGKWDLHVSSYKRCELCNELADLVDKADCSWAYGSLIDDAKQTIDPLGYHTDADPAVIGRIIGLLWLSADRRSTA